MQIDASDELTIQLKDDRAFTLPFLDSVLDLDELRKARPVDADFFAAVQAYVINAGGPQLSRGEACNLYEGLLLEHARKKKAWSDDMRSAYGLPPLTPDSIPGS